jgi:single-strand DNA-binding protein
MTEATVSFAGNLTDDPELRHTESGMARAMFRVAVSGRREQEASFFTVTVWRDQAEHAVESLSKGSRVVVMGRLQQRAWTAEDGSARSVVEVVAEELGPSLRWVTATTASRAVGSPNRSAHMRRGGRAARCGRPSAPGPVPTPPRSSATIRDRVGRTHHVPVARTSCGAARARRRS